jgi:hypothetical protein
MIRLKTVFLRISKGETAELAYFHETIDSDKTRNTTK